MAEASPSSASTLLQRFHSAAAADSQILDETHGLFGDLYSPDQVLSALREEAATSTYDDPNVGTPVAKTGLMIRSQDHALTTFSNVKQETVTPHEISLEVHNTTANHMVRLRWINQHGGHNGTSHQWDIAPSSTFEQYTKAGHLFVLSIVEYSSASSFSEKEYVLGAYRPKRALPSTTPHCLLVHGGDNPNKKLVLETLLLDETKFDALSVAAADLDQHHETSRHDREATQQRMELLHTIVYNVLKHPKEEKFHKLRLFNSKIHRHIASSWGAMELLRIVGFVQTSLLTTNKDQNANSMSENLEDYLVLSTLPNASNRSAVEGHCQQALDILAILQSRVAPGFVADLAPPTPWQAPGLATNIGTTNRSWIQQHRGFITDEERWARAERVASLRRSGASRKPAPGEAPSSRGNWGR
jgi:hypothetical protein